MTTEILVAPPLHTPPHSVRPTRRLKRVRQELASGEPDPGAALWGHDGRQSRERRFPPSAEGTRRPACAMVAPNTRPLAVGITAVAWNKPQTPRQTRVPIYPLGATRNTGKHQDTSHVKDTPSTSHVGPKATGKRQERVHVNTSNLFIQRIAIKTQCIHKQSLEANAIYSREHNVSSQPCLP
jgi:hypothetical protein